MKSSAIEIQIEGPDSSAIADELSSIIEAEFNTRPEQHKRQPDIRDRTVRSLDPLAISSRVLSIPSAILTVTDVVDRLKKKNKVDAILEKAKALLQQHGTTSIHIKLPDGTVMNIEQSTSSDLLLDDS